MFHCNRCKCEVSQPEAEIALNVLPRNPEFKLAIHCIPCAAYLAQLTAEAEFNAADPYYARDETAETWTSIPGGTEWSVEEILRREG